ncbi:hypothetical protein BHE74_00036044 [Ensete ventricosum]|nr:hypothetical protein GW17_00051787 [Ensete ventricosum]RWW57195.1 hypothetical protein BHE74_00036044 [Ensete ventricosum]
MSWSYVDHVVIAVPDRSPAACCRRRCTLVDCCVCLDTPPIASCQGPGGTVRRLTAAPAKTRRLSPVVGVQGGLV